MALYGLYCLTKNVIYSHIKHNKATMFMYISSFYLLETSNPSLTDASHDLHITLIKQITVYIAVNFT